MRLRRDFMVGDHVLLQFAHTISRDRIDAWAQREGYAVRKKLKTSDIYIIATPEIGTQAVDRLLAAVRSGFVASGEDSATALTTEPDYWVFQSNLPNDPQYNQLWGLHNTGQSGGVVDADIDAQEAWEISTGTRDVVVGVIDTGIDRNHPDLAANIWTNPGEIAGNNIDDDNNGFVDDVWGWDFHNDDNDPSDDDSHGTHCAGTIGAVGGNGSGVVGVNWEVSIAAIKFLGPGGGSTSDAIDSVNYANEVGVDLTSNSWGGGGYSSLLKNAIDQAGAAGSLFVAAAGNDNVNNDATPHYPSSYTSENLISVASSDRYDSRSSFSNYGSTSVDLAAPGSSIYSTIPNGNYGSKSGTSMATPHVAGAVALLKSIAPNLSPDALKQILFESVDPLPAFANNTVTGGRLNVFEAILRLDGAYVSVDALTVSDRSGDGIISPNEIVDLSLELVNRGQESAEALVATLEFESGSDFTPIVDSVLLGDLGSGQSLDISDAFSFSVSSSTPTPKTEEIAIRLEWGVPREHSAEFTQTLSVNTVSTISGRVVEASGGAPVSGAVVSYTGSSSGQVTADASGQYSLSLIDGNYALTADAPNFVRSIERNVTIPPAALDIDFQLGAPALIVQPTSIHETLFSGDIRSVSLTLENQGDVPLNWSSSVSSGVSQLHTLIARTGATYNPDVDRQADLRHLNTPMVTIPQTDLSGTHVGVILSGGYSTFLADLDQREATVISLSSYFSEGQLSDVDVLIIDDSVASLGAAQIDYIRDWIQNGGGFFSIGDNQVSLSKINAILSGCGITINHIGFAAFTYSNFEEHPTTGGVESVYTSARGGRLSVSGDARGLVYDSLGNPFAAASSLGSGKVFVAGDELPIDSNFSQGDARLFSNQIVKWLAGQIDWMDSDPTSGTIAAGDSVIVEVLLDASGLSGGIYTGSLYINSNDPQQPSTSVPVEMQVIGAPNLEIDPASLDFGQIYAGQSADNSVTLSNTGTDTLIIASASSNNSAFVGLTPLPVSLAPGESTEFTIQFNPDSESNFDGELTLTSNDSSNPTTLLGLSGEGVSPPSIEVSPGSFDIALGFGQSTQETLTISNSGGSDLIWTVVVEPAEIASPTQVTGTQIFNGTETRSKVIVDARSASESVQIIQQKSNATHSTHSAGSVRALEDVLIALNENFVSIQSLIPDRYDFRDGVTGNYISDGGNDMYDGGNRLRSNLSSTYIEYSDNALAPGSAYGFAGDYFTRKYDGLFVFAADLDGAGYFEITGDLGADGSGSADAAVLTRTVAGKSYTGYVKRVFGTSDPSVNHLIIVENAPDTYHDFDTFTNSDYHRLSGLPESARVYYLLFASASGGYINNAAMETIFEAFIEQVHGGGSWLVPDTFGGTIPTGQSQDIALDVSTLGLESGAYGATLSFETNTTLPFAINVPVNLTVAAASFTATPEALEFSTVPGVLPPAQSIEIQSNLGSELAWQASSDQTWLVLDAASGSTPATLGVSINPSAIPTVTSSAAITITSADTTREIPVRISVADLNVTQLITDHARSVLYAVLWSEGEANSLLAVINAETLAIESALSLPPQLTDVDLDTNSDYLYAISFAEKTITQVDLDVFAVSATRQLSITADHSQGDHYHIESGRPGIVYYSDAAWAPSIYVYDFDAGQVLSTYTGGGFGDFVVSSDANTIYGWRQYGWSAGISSSYIVTLDAQSNALTEIDRSARPIYRDPLDSMIALTAGNQVLVSKKFAFEASDLERSVAEFPEEIYAISSYGDLVLSEGHAYNGRSGVSLGDLDYDSKIMAFSANQERLVLFDASASQLRAIDTDTIMPLPPAELIPTPADGSAVNTAIDALRWNGSPLATGYDLYLGTDPTALANADANSPLYLGQTSGTAFDLPEELISENTQYYWRVDTVGFGGRVVQGDIWSFQSAALTVRPIELRIAAVQADYQIAAELQVDSESNSPWTAISEVPWLTLNTSSGTGTELIELTINLTGLPAGQEMGSILISDSSLSFSIPVELEIKELEIFKTTTDWASDYVYALHRDSQAPFDSLLLFLNADTETIDHVLPVGSNATDLTIHHGEDRIYVSNWTSNELQVVNRTTRELESPMLLDDDIYKINAGRNGRIYTEGQDQWISMGIWDTGSGLKVGPSNYFSLREGDAEISLSGDLYYHCDNNISNAHITKYDITTETPTVMASSLEHPYGSRTLTLSGDGESLFWRSYLYDEDLNELQTFPSEILASSFYGEVAISSNAIYEVETGDTLGSLPSGSVHPSVAPDNQKVVSFNTGLGRFEFTDLTQLLDLPQPDLTPHIENEARLLSKPAALGWLRPPNAYRFHVYLGNDLQAVGAALPDANSPEYLGETAKTEWAITDPLRGGQAWYWRVDAYGHNGLISSEIWSFFLSAATSTLSELSATVFTSQNQAQLSMQLGDLGPSLPWSIIDAPAWLTPSEVSGTTPAEIVWTFDGSGRLPDQYTATVSMSVGGDVYELPATLEVLQMNLTHLAADPETDTAWAIHQPDSANKEARLLFIDALTGDIERTLPAGRDVTDITLNRFDRLLYVSNWARGVVQVFDVDTRAFVETKNLDGDLYRLNAGVSGKLYSEGEDQWVTWDIWDTNTNQRLGPSGYFSTREGDAEISSDGLWYYHCGNNSSAAHISKFDIRTDNPIEVANSVQIGNGSRRLILSGDGSRLFWQGRVFDSDLNLIQTLSEEIYATTENGAVAFTADSALLSQTGDLLFYLPVNTQVMAVSDRTHRLVYFDSRFFDLRVQDYAVVTATAGATDFGTVLAGTTKATSITIANVTPWTQTIQLESDSAYLLPAQAELVLTPGSSFEIPVTFEALRLGSFSCTLTLAGSPTAVEPGEFQFSAETHFSAGNNNRITLEFSTGERGSYYWKEDGFTLDTFGSHIRTLPGASNRPDNGTHHIAFLYGTPPISLTADNGQSFRLVSIDLAEYSTVFANQPKNITFRGVKSDGSEVTHTFRIDGFVDGPGGQTDFEHFEFPPTFTNIVSLHSNDTIFSIDNIEIAQESDAFPIDSYLAWRDLHWPTAPEKSGIMEDFDDDGWSNLWEYIFDSDPAVSSVPLGALTLTGVGSSEAQLQFGHRAGFPQSLIGLEMATVLGSWDQYDWPSSASLQTDTQNGLSTISVDVPTNNASNMFFRLCIE